MVKKIYLAGPIFTEMEISYQVTLQKLMEEAFGEAIEIYNPAVNEEINDKTKFADSKMIAEADNMHLEASDILVANVDGQVCDVGVASEIGYFYSFERPIIALYTDARVGNTTEEKVAALEEPAESQFSYFNLYTSGLIKKRGKFVRSKEELIEALKEIV